MDQLIGMGYKEYIVIERELINELLKESEEFKESKGMYANGIGEGIKRTIERIKENNLYNREFEIHK